MRWAPLWYLSACAVATLVAAQARGQVDTAAAERCQATAALQTAAPMAANHQQQAATATARGIGIGAGQPEF